MICQRKDQLVSSSTSSLFLDDFRKVQDKVESQKHGDLSSWPGKEDDSVAAVEWTSGVGAWIATVKLIWVQHTVCQVSRPRHRKNWSPTKTQ